MPMFRVMAGAHVVTDEKAKVAPGQAKPEIQYEVGEILESPVDLVKRFPGKFQKVLTKKNIEELPDDEVVTDKTIVEEPDEPEDTLEKLSIKELREYAAQMKVNITGLKDKDSILVKLREAIKE